MLCIILLLYEQTILGMDGTAFSRCTFTWSLEQNIAVKVFGGDAIERLRIIFAKTCTVSFGLAPRISACCGT